MKTERREKGQALILIALAAVGLFAFSALAIDGSMVYSVKRQAQNAADASALAAALAKTRDQDWHQAGMITADVNTFNNDGTHNTVVVYQCDDPNATCTGLPTGPGVDPSQYIQVKIQANVTTYFTRIIGRGETQTAVDAIARSVPDYYDQMMYGNAVVALAPTECNAIWANGHPDTDIIGGGIFSNSECDSTAFRQNGSGTITVTDGDITVVGGAQYASGHVSPVPDVDPSAHIPYPPPMTMPNPQCTGNAAINGTSMSPGSWYGSFPGSATHLDPGIYCVHGDFDLHGGDTLTGSNVLIVMESGSITWNGNSTAQLSGPTEGPYVGLLIYFRFDPADPFANNGTIKINGTAGMQLTGSILAPASDVNILGTGDVNGFNSQIIGYTVQFGGTSDATVHYDDSVNFDTQFPPHVELIK